MHNRRIRFICTTVLAALLLTACSHTSASASPQDPPLEDVKYISTETTRWMYLDENQELFISPTGQQWTLPGYDSSTWRQGIGPFGAKDGTNLPLSEDHIITTLLNQYADGTTNSPSFFFRTTFQVENTANISSLIGEITYDDAVILYLNGHRVFSGNIPEEDYSDNYSFGSQETYLLPLTNPLCISADYLVNGENTLAVEIRQSHEYSSDIYFDLPTLSPSTTVVSGSQPADVIFIGPGADETSVSINWTRTGMQNENACIYLWDYSHPESVVSIPATLIEETAIGVSYRAAAENLSPDTTYCYSTIGFSTAEGEFRTGNLKNGVDLLLLGDPQLHSYDSDSLIPALVSNLKQFAKEQDLLVCLGDIASEAEDAPIYRAFINCLRKSRMPSAVLYGNHDAPSDHLSSCINLPNMSPFGIEEKSGSMSGDYWFAYGDSLFYCLNGNHEDFSQHRTFLEAAGQEYESIHGKPKWKLVLMHQAPYGQGNHLSDWKTRTMQTELAPIFSELGIDVVISGHDHVYSRSWLIRDGEVVPYEGSTITKAPGEVLYLTLSSSTGSKYYDLADQQPYTAKCIQEYTPMLSQVNITDKQIRVTVTDTQNGQIVDEFSLRK